MPTATFITSNNVMFQVDHKILKVAENMEALLECHLQLGLLGSEQDIIDLPTVDSYNFAKLIDWMIRHREDHEDEENGVKSGLRNWEKAFFAKLNLDSLSSLMTTAKSFSVKCLEKSIGEYVTYVLTEKSSAMSKWRLLFGKEVLLEQGLDDDQQTADIEE